jgi:hypothetical protein
VTGSDLDPKADEVICSRMNCSICRFTFFVFLTNGRGNVRKIDLRAMNAESFRRHQSAFGAIISSAFVELASKSTGIHISPYNTS